MMRVPSAAPSFKTTGLYFISENFLPDPQWEAVHYKPSQLTFPFFSSEPTVIVLEVYAPFLQQYEKLLKEMKELSLQTQLIFFSLDLAENALVDLFNLQRPFRLIPHARIAELQKPIQEAMEQGQNLKQEQVLYQLFREQNKELQEMTQNLESRIEKRQNHIEEARARLSAANEKNIFLQKCLFAVHNSTTIADLEKTVTELLHEPLSLDWFRIQLELSLTSNLLETPASTSLYRFPLTLAQRDYGQLLFARKSQTAFRRDEKELLETLSEAISFCVEKMLQIERNRELQSQWQSTFNAILDPVCLIDENYNLHLVNKSLSPKKQVLGKKCYEILFQRQSPCTDCQRGQTFRLRESGENAKVYDVFSQSMVIDYQKSYFHLYRDISQQLGLERQLVESAKLAELGTISSSIAHELNNPLGGMINFIQLIKMDLPAQDPLRPDVDEMEKAALRCKDIVKNLLSFSRTAKESEVHDIPLVDVIKRAIMITELRTRSLGIRIQFPDSEEALTVRGRFNPLAQVFCNILQNSYESIITKRKTIPDFKGEIIIQISTTEKGIDIDIFDNGVGLANNETHHFFDPLFTTKDPEKHSGLGLTLAKQILTEHSARIDLTTQKDGRTRAHLHFPRLSSHAF